MNYSRSAHCNKSTRDDEALLKKLVAGCIKEINAFPDEVLSGENRHAIEADMPV